VLRSTCGPAGSKRAGRVCEAYRLAEALPHCCQGTEASLEFVRLVGVAGAEAGFELVESFQLSIHEVLSFLIGPAAKFSQERLAGVGRPLEAESAGDGGEGTPLLAQRHGVAVGVAPRLGPRAGISIFSRPCRTLPEGPVWPAVSRQGEPG
jgi:hypothetical protein